MRALKINDETWMLSSAVPIPMVGVLAVNSFVLLGDQPTVIDTGISPDAEEWMAELEKIVDPADLRWIVVTHADRDHTGALMELMARAPQAPVVTGFINVGIMSVGAEPIPPEHAFLVRDGSTFDLGDRTLAFMRPPLFDNPGTLGVFDPKQKILFSADFFGAALESEESALAEDVASIDAGELEAGQTLWGTVDSPWSLFLDEKGHAARVESFVASRPETVLSVHLPPIRSDVDAHVRTVSKVPSASPWTSPDQAALEAFMASMSAHG